MATKRKSMLLAAILSLTFVLSGFAFSGCSKKETYNAVQIDVNPSVEFVVDSKNKVVNATALNDDGAVILSGEVFVGKDADEAVGLFLQISTETGYLLKGEAKKTADGEVVVSISVNGEAAKKLYDKLEAKAKDVLESEQIKAVVKKGEALKLETLRATVAVCRPDLTQEEIADMSEEELLTVLKESRDETKEILSASIREAYYQAKAYRVSLAECEAVKAAIGDANAIYQAMLIAYDGMVTTLKNTVAALEKAEYDYLIDPESEYQQAVKTVLEAKKEVMIQQEKVDALADGLEKTAAQAILDTKKATLSAAETALSAAKNIAETALSTSKAAVNVAISALTEARKNFPEEISSSLTKKTKEIDEKINAEKDAFFERFETAYGDAMDDYNNYVASMKEARKNRTEGEVQTKE